MVNRSDHAKNHIETETKHPFTTAEFALKFLRHMLYSVLVQDTLSSQCLAPSRSLNGYLWTDRKKKNLKKCWAGSWEGRGMSRTSIPARGRIAILLVTSRYRNKNRLLLDRHLGSSTDLSLYALNKKYIARIEAMKFFFLDLRFIPKNSNIALSMFTVFIWSFITTLIQFIWSLRTLSANNLKISCF